MGDWQQAIELFTVSSGCFSDNMVKSVGLNEKFYASIGIEQHFLVAG
jgi:hypothetical protein